MNSRHHQSGVALVTAILLVAIATALATKLAWDNQVSMRRTESILALEQARAIALGAEAVAMEILLQDDPTFDNEGEYWDDKIAPVPVGIDEIDLGLMVGRISDAQGKFNLNNLIPPGSGSNTTGQPVQPDPVAKAQFERLINILKLDPAIVDAVIDWIDPDTLPQAHGAEDGMYTALDPPYRPANNYLTSVSELRAIAYVDAESYAILLPHVTAFLPQWCGGQNGTSININFATAEVLESLHKDITPGEAQAWVQERDKTGWSDWSEVSNWTADYAALQGREADIKSNCFVVNVTVSIGSSVMTMYSLLERSPSGDQVITRSRVFGLE